MKPATTTAPPKRSRPILVVEDDPFVLSMLMRTLESFGYEAEEATDGPRRWTWRGMGTTGWSCSIARCPA